MSNHLPTITLRKSSHFSVADDYRRYEIDADGKSIGWTVGGFGGWSVHYRTADGHVLTGFTQSTRGDAVDVVCMKAIGFYGYGD